MGWRTKSRILHLDSLSVREEWMETAQTIDNVVLAVKCLQTTPKYDRKNKQALIGRK